MSQRLASVVAICIRIASKLKPLADAPAMDGGQLLIRQSNYIQLKKPLALAYIDWRSDWVWAWITHLLLWQHQTDFRTIISSVTSRHIHIYTRWAAFIYPHPDSGLAAQVCPFRWLRQMSVCEVTALWVGDTCARPSSSAVTVIMFGYFADCCWLRACFINGYVRVVHIIWLFK